MDARPDLDRKLSINHQSSRTDSDVRKTLLVDDDPAQLRIRAAVLRGAGLEVSIATSVSAAMSMLRADIDRHVGVVVTDHLMSDASGAEFVRELRRILPTLPVVVITGLPEAEPEYDGLQVIFRQKPCPPPELIAIVRRSLESAA